MRPGATTGYSPLRLLLVRDLPCGLLCVRCDLHFSRVRLHRSLTCRRALTSNLSRRRRLGALGIASLEIQRLASGRLLLDRLNTDRLLNRLRLVAGICIVALSRS